jgi:hypothetical protein
MHQITIEPVKPLARVQTPAVFPPNPLDMFLSTNFYKVFLASVAYNGYPSDEEALWTSWSDIGLGPNSNFVITALPANAQLALQDALPIAKQIVTGYLKENPNPPRPSGLYTFNGWSTVYPANPFEKYYLERATTTFTGNIGSTTPDTQFYLASDKDGNNQQLNGSLHNYTIHFAANQLPQIDPIFGEWSITLYTPGPLTLYANTYNIYAVGTNTGLLQFNQNGSLDIYIQNIAPNNSTNFIPCPTGLFTLIMRIYRTDPEQYNDFSNIPPVLPY